MKNDDLVVGYVGTFSIFPSSCYLFSIINFANFLQDSNLGYAGAFLMCAHDLTQVTSETPQERKLSH